MQEGHDLTARAGLVGTEGRVGGTLRDAYAEAMKAKCSAPLRESKLKLLRESRGLSQSELAAASGVHLRNIQLYEQRVNDIDKAQAKTVYKLARVIGCNVEDLLENPMT